MGTAGVAVQRIIADAASVEDRFAFCLPDDHFTRTSIRIGLLAALCNIVLEGGVLHICAVMFWIVTLIPVAFLPVSMYQ